MLHKFEKHMALCFPFLFKKKLLVAVSGGIDSVVLTHLLIALNNAEVALAHCNFQLRSKESDLDEEFVKTLGNKLKLRTFTIKFNTKQYSKKHKLSTQLSARQLRYDWFEELIEKYNFDYVITAHHADDNLETFLINLSRGTGLEGLTGIPKKNKNIVRPLLIFSRDEISNFAKSNNINWREDVTNSETKYLRNKFRHEIIPKLKEINPNLLDSFCKTISFLNQSKQLVNDRIEEISKEIVSKNGKIIQFNITKIKQLHNPKTYLYELLKNYGFTNWDDVYNLLSAQSGKFLVTKSYRLLKDRDFLLLSQFEGRNDLDDVFYITKNYNGNLPININIKSSTLLQTIKTKNFILVNENLLNYPLILRRWKEGDFFFPLGMKGKKKVSKFFKDERLSLIEKEETWLLCSNKNEIIWIVGMRQDKRFSVNKETKNVIKISI